MLIFWILFGPVMLTIDTDRNVYRFMLPGVISLKLVPGDEIFKIKGWIFFVPFRMNPFTAGKKSGKKKKVPKKKSKGKRKTPGLGTIQRALGLIRIKRLELDMDTDDFLLNAWLVPAFSAVSQYQQINMRVNFEGNLFLFLDARTRIGAILWMILKMKVKS